MNNDYKMRFSYQVEFAKFDSTYIHAQTPRHTRKDLFKIRKVLNVDTCIIEYAWDTKAHFSREIQEVFWNKAYSDKEYKKWF